MTVEWLQLASMGALSWALTYAIHSTLLIGGVWLVCRGIKPLAQRVGPSFENRAWKLALVGGLATATIQVGAGLTPAFGAIELPSNQTAQAAEPTQVSEDTAPVIATAAAGERVTVEFAPARLHGHVVHGDRELLLLDEGRIVALRERSPAPPPFVFHGGTFAPLVPELDGDTPAVLGASTSATTDAGPGAPSLPVWPMVLLGAWLLGTAVTFTRLGRGVLALRRRLAPRSEVLVDPVLESFLTLCRDTGIRRKIRLTQLAGLGSPIALWAREIVVPERAVEELSPAAMRSALAHELAHLERRDPHWLALAALIESLLFFQPLNRLARKGMQESAELLADDWAIARTGDGIGFAKALAELASWAKQHRTPQHAALVAGMLSDERPLLRRVRRALDGDPARLRPEGHRPGRMALGLSALAALVVFAPGVVNAGPEQDEEAEAKAKERSKASGRAEAREGRRARKQQAAAEKRAERARAKAQKARRRAIEASEQAERAARDAEREAREAEREARALAPRAPHGETFLHIQDGGDVVIIDGDGLRVQGEDGELIILDGQHPSLRIEGKDGELLILDGQHPSLRVQVPEEGFDFDLDFEHPEAALEGMMGVEIDGVPLQELIEREVTVELQEELGEELGEEFADALTGLIVGSLSGDLSEEQLEALEDRAEELAERAEEMAERAGERTERELERAEAMRERAMEQRERELERAERNRERSHRRHHEGNRRHHEAAREELERAREELERELERIEKALEAEGEVPEPPRPPKPPKAAKPPKPSKPAKPPKAPKAPKAKAKSTPI
ncbi:hypothetical protein PPSIR1_35697 [Plesiocystis pacifica SIR-1]|uniref:Peptidase M56 domain-containing protein n=1 Tax=Plesiocystis pacifica SIR-1 TaxID=391625 RepID=A6G1R8_9BACT|nr:M56 family metallopeptidase [Plesiocystis pacifica]EDM80108.1 hypothetical protein PPSIR1_35697 [Plesiocystis pacifica SIR-1]